MVGARAGLVMGGRIGTDVEASVAAGATNPSNAVGAIAMGEALPKDGAVVAVKAEVGEMEGSMGVGEPDAITA